MVFCFIIFVYAPESTPIWAKIVCYLSLLQLRLPIKLIIFFIFYFFVVRIYWDTSSSNNILQKFYQMCLYMPSNQECFYWDIAMSGCIF